MRATSVSVLLKCLHRFTISIVRCYADVNANIAQIVQASGGRPTAIPFLITIMSLASCLSRVLVGATAQLFEDAGLPRTLFVLGSVSCMLGSQLCLATATNSGLYIGATLGQFGYGACCTFCLHQRLRTAARHNNIL